MQLSGGNYFLRKGDYVTVPHELHMLDPSYYDEPTKFKPERLLVTGEDGKLFLNLGTIRPFGGGKVNTRICQLKANKSKAIPFVRDVFLLRRSAFRW